MKILLINNNPVVSRLTALSARKEDVEIDEIQEVIELTEYNYDIVFVDADSWNEDVESTIFTHIKTKKRVLFHAQDDKNSLNKFDKCILKPFLPSEVSAVIRSVEESNTLNAISDEIEEEKSTNLEEESKEIKLEDSIEDLTLDESTNLEVAESKTDLIDELTKIDNLEIDEKIDLNSTDIQDDLFKDKSAKLDINTSDFASKSEGDLFDLGIDDSKNSLDDELFTSEAKADEKVVEDSLLEFDLDKDNEVNLEKEMTTLKDEAIAETKTEIETKVLDVEEIENIKEILDDDKSPTMELDDLMTPSLAGIAGVTAVTALSEDDNQDEENENIEKKKKKKSKKEKRVVSENVDTSDTIVDRVSSMKVESLKELLAGATVTINIQFPKA